MHIINKKRCVAVAGSVYKYLATGEDTGGAYSVFETIIPPRDQGPPPHIHKNEDEAFYILKGEFIISIGDEVFRAVPGDFAYLPRGISHSFKSQSDEVGKLLAIVSPSGFEKFFDAVGEPVADENAIPPPPSEEHIRKIIEQAPKFGIQLIL